MHLIVETVFGNCSHSASEFGNWVGKCSALRQIAGKTRALLRNVGILTLLDEAFGRQRTCFVFFGNIHTCSSKFALELP